MKNVGVKVYNEREPTTRSFSFGIGGYSGGNEWDACGGGAIEQALIRLLCTSPAKNGRGFVSAGIFTEVAGRFSKDKLITGVRQCRFLQRDRDVSVTITIGPEMLSLTHEEIKCELLRLYGEAMRQLVEKLRKKGIDPMVFESLRAHGEVALERFRNSPLPGAEVKPREVRQDEYERGVAHVEEAFRSRRIDEGARSHFLNALRAEYRVGEDGLVNGD